MIRVLLLDSAGVPVAGGQHQAKELPSVFAFASCYYDFVEQMQLGVHCILAVYRMRAV